MGFQSGANNLLMQNYPIDVAGASNQNNGNYSHQRVYSHHDANELVNQGGGQQSGHMASLAGKFKKKNGRLVQDHIGSLQGNSKAMPTSQILTASNANS